MNQRSRVSQDPSVTTLLRMSSRPAFFPSWALGGVVAIALTLLMPLHPAAAQGRLDARYEATLAGIPVGKGTWTIEITDDGFAAAATGGTAGLLKAFAGGTGTSGSQGRVVNGALVGTSYVATMTTQKKS